MSASNVMKGSNLSPNHAPYPCTMTPNCQLEQRRRLEVCELPAVRKDTTVLCNDIGTVSFDLLNTHTVSGQNRGERSKPRWAEP